MTRPGEWHISTDPETRRRLRVYAALHGLTLGAALKQLLDLGEGGRASGDGAREPHRERPQAGPERRSCERIRQET